MDSLSGRELLRFRTAPQLKGFRLTRERKVILDVLLEAEKPLTAEEIFDRVEADIALSTVYRTLDKLVRRGYVHQTLLSTDGHAVFELTGNAHRHYMVCLGCHRMFPLASCPVVGFHDPSATQLDFEVVDHSFVLYGYCHDCRAKGKSLGLH